MSSYPNCSVSYNTTETKYWYKHPEPSLLLAIQLMSTYLQLSKYNRPSHSYSIQYCIHSTLWRRLRSEQEGVAIVDINSIYLSIPTSPPPPPLPPLSCCETSVQDIGHNQNKLSALVKHMISIKIFLYLVSIGIRVDFCGAGAAHYDLK